MIPNHSEYSPALSDSFFFDSWTKLPTKNDICDNPKPLQHLRLKNSGTPCSGQRVVYVPFLILLTLQQAAGVFFRYGSFELGDKVDNRLSSVFRKVWFNQLIILMNLLLTTACYPGLITTIPCRQMSVLSSDEARAAKVEWAWR